MGTSDYKELSNLRCSASRSTVWEKEGADQLTYTAPEVEFSNDLSNRFLKAVGSCMLRTQHTRVRDHFQ